MNSVTEAVTALGSGDAVVIPTDTVYGIAADPWGPGVTRIFELKERPLEKPLAVLGSDLSQLIRVGRLEGAALELARAFWPGPLTLVVKRAPDFEVDLGGEASDDTVALRVPAHPLAIDILKALGPLAVTSANPSGRTPAIDIEQARAYFGDSVPVYVDGGACDGEVSTVVRVTDEVEILRTGALSADRLRRVIQS